MAETDFKKYSILGLILLLAALSVLVIRPLLTPIVLGLFLAYIFYPLYLYFEKKWKSKYLAASIVLGIAVLIVLIPILLILPSLANQILNFYLTLKSLDIGSAIANVIPYIADNKALYGEVIATMSNFNATVSDWILNFFKSTIMNLPEIMFGILILMFTFFFALTESIDFKQYVSVILPFSKEQEKLFFNRLKQVTDSVIFGQVIVGIAQGIVAGVGYFIIGIPNAMLITVLTIIVGILPVIGPAMVWIPVDLFLFISGQVDLGIMLLIYGLFVMSPIDTLMRPILVSEKAQMNSALVLIGMVGGAYAFGFIGFLLGPLIIAALVLLIEIYKDKKGGEESVLLKEVSSEKV